MRSKSYGAESARAHLPELLERAHHGTPTIITKRGKAYAVVSPVGGVIARRGTAVLSLKGSGAGLWDDDTVATLRDEWE